MIPRGSTAMSARGGEPEDRPDGDRQASAWAIIAPAYQPE